MIRTALVVTLSTVLLAACASTSSPSSERIVSHHGYSASELGPHQFQAAYDGPSRWSTAATHYGFLYWTSLLTIQSGDRYFVVGDESIYPSLSHYEPGNGDITTVGGAGAGGGDGDAVVRGGSLMDIDRHFRLEGTVRTFAKKPGVDGVFDAQSIVSSIRESN